MSAEIDAAVIAELRAAVDSGDLVLFVGGGIAAAAGLPTWRQLVDAAAELVRERVGEGPALDELGDLAKAGRYIEALAAAEHALGEGEFAAFVRRELDDAGHELPKLAVALAALRHKLRAVLTTNINRLLERAFGPEWETRARVTDDLASRRRFILKLHGTIEDQRSWIFTRRDFQATLAAPHVRKALSALFRRCPVLFVGFGRGDESFDEMLRDVRDLSGDAPPRRFVLVPSGSLMPYRRRSLVEMGFALLPYDADNGHAQALEILERLGGEAPATSHGPRSLIPDLELPPSSSSPLRFPPEASPYDLPILVPAVPREVAVRARASEPPANPIEVFFSYSERDRDLRDKLETHLSILKRKGVIRGWHEGEIGAGEEFERAVREHLDTAQVILLLVSADFLASDFCYEDQMKRAIQRHERGEARVIPIILDACDWELAPFSGLKALPDDKRPVTSWANQSEAFTNIARGIRRHVELLTQNPQPGAPSAPAQPVSHSEVPPPPGIWSIPPWAGRNLAARDALLGEIGRTLARRGVAPLCGLGGSGKTQLAIEYAHRNAGAYDTVCLIRGDSAAFIEADLAALAAELRLPDHDQGGTREGGVPMLADRARAAASVRTRLGRRGRWLLIFDEAREPKVVEPYMPSSAAGGHVLVTSRNPIWRGLSTVTVRGFERTESVRFLLQRTGETDVESADALAEELGDLPLALAQAGAYIEETGRPLSEYLALFRQRPMALLERPASFPFTVATTWESSLADVFSHEAAAELLSLCAFLPMDEIPRRALADHDPLVLDEAIATLRLHSFVEVRPNAVSVHRLLKVVVRSQLRRDDRLRWADAARRILQLLGRESAGTDEEREGGTDPDAAARDASGRWTTLREETFGGSFGGKR